MTGPIPAGRPPSPPPEGGRPPHVPIFRRPTLPRIAAALAVSVGVALAAAGTTALVTAAPPRPKTTDVGTLPITQTQQTAPPAARPAAPPARLRIDSIGIDTPLIDLQVQQDGHLSVPDDPDQVGWWSGGPRPGDPGAAVIVGHIDSLSGPAAFYNLSSLRPGDTVTIDRTDYTRIDFTVRALRQYAKNDIPDDQVYATTGPPELRLITCGGTFDHAAHEYLDNLVVYATRTPPPPPKPSTPPPHGTPHRSGT